VKKLFFLLAILLAGCTTVPLMQQSYFDQVSAGSSISGVEAIYGQPYEIRELPNDLQEYVYIQRIDLGRSATEQMEFVFLVNQGVVVSKECRRSGTSNFQFTGL
jgi:hypothetical protein